MHRGSWFNSIPFIKEICFPFLTSSLPYWYFLNLQINCWLFVSESPSGWTPGKTSIMPRAETGCEFRHSVSRVRALPNPSADTRRKARQRARKKAQRLEKICWVWRNSSIWLEQGGLGSGMCVGEDMAGNATWDESMNHLQVKLRYLTFITKVAGSHDTVLLRLGYNQRHTCKSSFWCKEGAVGAVGRLVVGRLILRLQLPGECRCGQKEGAGLPDA